MIPHGLFQAPLNGFTHIALAPSKQQHQSVLLPYSTVDSLYCCHIPRLIKLEPKLTLQHIEFVVMCRQEAGCVRRGRSIDRAGIDRIVRDVARKAAQSSKAWRQKTDGGFFRGKTVTSHNLRSAFMNRVDPENNTSAEVFPGKAPFHPNDWYSELLILSSTSLP
jgi:hypothetical protein